MILTNSLIFFVVGFWRSSFDFTFANEILQTSDSQQPNSDIIFKDKKQINNLNIYYLKSLNQILTNNLNNKKFLHSSKQQSKKERIQNYPIVVNTWAFVNATAKAWQVLQDTDDRLSAVEAGCSECEELRCDGTVGYGGSPDETGETTLDAVIMDGVTHDAGSIAGLKRIKNAISVARAVMDYTKHTMLVEESATQFAIDMGFKQTDLHSIESMKKWIDWFNNSCQPNFRRNVWPSASKNCGPYKPLSKNKLNEQEQVTQRNNPHVSAKSHDTIGMLVLDSKGNIAGGTSTNGASHKIPGYLFKNKFHLNHKMIYHKRLFCQDVLVIAQL
jgi:isoaspartyl peptidase/L-asparaginase-like protein (Ntn-hydrolase superfamily)